MLEGWSHGLDSLRSLSYQWPSRLCPNFSWMCGSVLFHAITAQLISSQTIIWAPGCFHSWRLSCASAVMVGLEICHQFASIFKVSALTGIWQLVLINILFTASAVRQGYIYSVEIMSRHQVRTVHYWQENSNSPTNVVFIVVTSILKTSSCTALSISVDRSPAPSFFQERTSNAGNAKMGTLLEGLVVS